ncbi:MAG: hypothetical protein QF619_06075, partial [Candidatus Binatia bacterium]|nr:hypothetical protein [Candidatus Binatia bacterium]
NIVCGTNTPGWSRATALFPVPKTISPGRDTSKCRPSHFGLPSGTIDASLAISAVDPDSFARKLTMATLYCFTKFV